MNAVKARWAAHLWRRGGCVNVGSKPRHLRGVSTNCHDKPARQTGTEADLLAIPEQMIYFVAVATEQLCGKNKVTSSQKEPMYAVGKSQSSRLSKTNPIAVIVGDGACSG